MIKTAGTKLDHLATDFRPPQGLPQAYDSAAVYSASVGAPASLSDRLDPPGCVRRNLHAHRERNRLHVVDPKPRARACGQLHRAGVSTSLIEPAQEGKRQGAAELEVDRGFVCATGIECSAPKIGGGLRMDELEKTRHYEHVEQDLRMVAELGLTFLRYGIPYHRVNPDRGIFNWSFADRALELCRAHGLTPIVDLLHFGVPDYIGDFQNSRLPELFADYAARFADRYPWVRYYTPVNEPLITAQFSARDGMWNERLTGDAPFARALVNVCAAAVRATEAIRLTRPDAVIIQSDTCEAYHATHRDAIEMADFYNELRFLGFELVYGRPIGGMVRRYMLDSGIAKSDLAWFEAHGSDANCIAGNDYYATSEKDVGPGGTLCTATNRLGYARLGRRYHVRLGVPLMHAETNMAGGGAVAWLREQWTEVNHLRQIVPVRGFTWYGFINHVDWDTELQENNGRENSCGLVSLERVPNPTHAAFRELIASLQP